MRLIGLFVAIALAAAAAFVTMKLTTKEKPDEVKVVVEPKIVEKEVPTVDVLVARAPIPVGSPLRADIIDRQPWPSHLVLEDFIISDGADTDIMGLVTRSPFQAKEPIIRSKLANPSDPSFLAANLRPGMRAATIATDAISGVAGFVFPGDHVDVLITHEVEMTKERTDPQTGRVLPGKKEKVSEILLSDVTVIALDQRATAQGAQGPAVSTNATIEVTPFDAQRLRLAEKTGTMSLVLRAFDKDAAAKPDAEKEPEKMVRPAGLKDLSNILPSSNFSVLYDKRGGKAALVKDEGEEDQSSAKEEEGPAAAPSIDIVIIRGTQREILGVDRP